VEYTVGVGEGGSRKLFVLAMGVGALRDHVSVSGWVWGLGLGFRVWGLGLLVCGVMYLALHPRKTSAPISDLGFRVQDSGFKFRVQGLVSEV
jgi:hypothetical protein